MYFEICIVTLLFIFVIIKLCEIYRIPVNQLDKMNMKDLRRLYAEEKKSSNFSVKGKKRAEKMQKHPARQH